MAKVSLRYTEPAARAKRHLLSRKLPSAVFIHRTGAVGKKAFEACVRIGGGTISSRSLKRASYYTTSCMHGSNPRAALSSALSRSARQMKKRSGAFARYR